MFREMRRKKQQLSPEICEDILTRGTSGVLALLGDDDYPYAVPISYVYDGAKLYFHCAKSGHKLDAIRKSSKASFCVIGQDVIVFGKIRILEGDREKREAVEKLAIKYAPDDTVSKRQEAIDHSWAPLCMLEMTIEHMTGKEAIELAKRRTENT